MSATQDKTYNGWTNYETWAVGMFLDGNYDGEGTYRQAREIVSENAARGVYEVEQALQEFVSESIPELDGLAGDLLGAAISEVNWNEIATSQRDEIVEEWKREAKEEGISAARAVASWITDGNDTDDSRRSKLQAIEDGDSERFIRYPNLSGEFADDPTPASVAEDITGSDEVDDDLVDALAEAWEDGVSSTFEDACVTELRKWLDES